MAARASCVNAMRWPSCVRRGAMELARRLLFFRRALCSHARKAFHSGTFCRNLLSGLTCHTERRVSTGGRVCCTCNGVVCVMSLASRPTGLCCTFACMLASLQCML